MQEWFAEDVSDCHRGAGSVTMRSSGSAHDFSRRDFSRCLRADVVGIGGGKKKADYSGISLTIAVVVCVL